MMKVTFDSGGPLVFVSDVTPARAVRQIKRFLSAVEQAPDGDYEINVTSEFDYIEQTTITASSWVAPHTQIITVRRLA